MIEILSDICFAIFAVAISIIIGAGLSTWLCELYDKIEYQIMLRDIQHLVDDCKDEERRKNGQDRGQI